MHVDRWYQSDGRGMYVMQVRAAQAEEGVAAGDVGTEAVVQSVEAGGQADDAEEGNLVSARGKPVDESAEVGIGDNWRSGRLAQWQWYAHSC